MFTIDLWPPRSLLGSCVLWTLVSACSGVSQQAAAPTGQDTRLQAAQEPSSPPVADAGLPDAATSTAEATEPDASLAFRDFVPPKARVLEPAILARDIEQAGSCRLVSAQDYEQEGRRVIAALDAQLRAEGGMLLTPVGDVLGGLSIDPANPQSFGEIFRGPKGERFMRVGSSRACYPPPPIVLSKDKEVFVTWPDTVAKKKRKIRACMGPCGGCGAHMPDTILVVEVPEGAHLLPSRPIRVIMKEGVVFESVRTCPPKP